MKSRYLVDSELLGMLDTLPTIDLTEELLPVIRATGLLGTAPGSDNVSAYAAAARADDLSGLPPTFISTGALDLFLEEDMDYARRLIRQGVPVELHVYPGAYHAFDFLTNAPIAAAARRDSLAALRRFLR